MAQTAQCAARRYRRARARTRRQAHRRFTRSASDRSRRRCRSVRGRRRRRSRRTVHYPGCGAGRRRRPAGGIPLAGRSRRRRRPAIGAGAQMRAILENLAGRRSRSTISRRDAARRAGAARMGSDAQSGRVGAIQGSQMADATQSQPAWSYVWGRLSAFGLTIAAITCAADQASKFWLLSDFDLANRGSVAVAPVINLVLTWNTGISYGLFPQQGPVGAWALLAFKAAAIVFLWVWLTRSPSRLTAAALGLIIGGAVG